MIEEFIGTSFRAGAALLTALKHRDHYTEAHCTRVARLAWHTGEALGVALSDLGCLISAAVLHDVGKIGIPDRILLYSGSLDSYQYEEIKAHSEIGANIVEKLDIPTARRVAELVRWHHERVDGQGYPDGLTEDEIPLGARIISVVDAFDAITSTRRYRLGLEVNEALLQLEAEAGTRFGVDVVAALKQVVGENGDSLELEQTAFGCGS